MLAARMATTPGSTLARTPCTSPRAMWLVLPPKLAVAVYPVIGLPPLEAGADQASVT